MRFPIVLFLHLAMMTTLQAQSLAEKIAKNASERLSKIENYAMLQDSVQPVITAAMVKAMATATPEEKEQLGTVEGIKSTLEEACQLLPAYCSNIRRFIIEDKTLRFYKMSDNEQANLHYNQGTAFMENDALPQAISEFKSALEYDPQFVYALDHLALSYRRQKDYESALASYKKSLAIFPEGDVALLNIAATYSYMMDYAHAARYYDQLKFLHPDNPEGYFGLARMLFMAEQYDKALDNLFVAYGMYKEANSHYLKDSEQLMQIIYARLKELHKTDLMEQKASEHHFSLDDLNLSDE